MRALLVLATFAALLPIVPSAAAASCDAVTEPYPGVPVPTFATFYVVPSTSAPEVWHETNGVAGLQRVDCTDADGRVRPKDAKNGSYPLPGWDDLPCRLSGTTLQCW